MTLSASTLECPNCGARILPQARVCDYCHSAIIVRRIQEVGNKDEETLNRYVKLYKNSLKKDNGESVETLTALAICLLKRGAYDESIGTLKKAVSLLPEDGESHYLLALALMRKKRPYRHTLKEIKKIVEYLETALTYSTSGKYYYLLYLIQNDFYDQKRLKNGKNSQELLTEAVNNEVDDEEILECKEYCGL